MRKFAFVVFDIDETIIDRFKLDNVTDLKGLGWRLNLSTIKGDVVDIVTKVHQEKENISFKIHFVNYAYEKSALLDQWLEKYSRIDKYLALEYSDGLGVRYVEGKVISLSKSEKDEYNRLVRDCVFKPVSPFFRRMENKIRIKVSNQGKSYPYKYPYSYGKNMIENNEINNTYIQPVPVIVTIKGSIDQPNIQLLDEHGQAYTRVWFPETTLTDTDYIIINSAQQKIWLYTEADGLIDYSDAAHPSQDRFLLAESGFSRISINLESFDTGELTGSWRQFGL